MRVEKLDIVFDPRNGATCPDYRVDEEYELFIADALEGHERYPIGSEILLTRFRVGTKENDIGTLKVTFEITDANGADISRVCETSDGIIQLWPKEYKATNMELLLRLVD